MQINLYALAGICGFLGFVCWFMASRNKKPDAERTDVRTGWKPGLYLRAGAFTTRGNFWRIGYLLFNGLAVLSFAGLLYINLT